MFSNIFAGAALTLILTAGAAVAQVPSRTPDVRLPAATGSIRDGARTDGAFEVGERAPSLFGPQRPVRSTFNPSTARARHYER